jgi:hypothetical protein
VEVKRVTFDFSRLRGRIVEKYGSCAAFAQALGKSKATISGKLCNQVSITSDEIVEWSRSDRLDIPTAEVHAYFLTPEV